MGHGGHLAAMGDGGKGKGGARRIGCGFYRDRHAGALRVRPLSRPPQGLKNLGTVWAQFTVTTQCG